MSQDFTLDDFRRQFETLAKTNQQDTTWQTLGMSEMVPEGEGPEAAMRRVRDMIDAMTPEERRDPDRIDEAARQRIATASDTRPDEVAEFLKQFAQVRELMRHFAGMSFWQRIKLLLDFGQLPKKDDA